MEKVSLLKRAIAYFVDLYLGTLLSSIPISVVTMITLNQMTQNVFLLEKSLAILSLLLSLICMIFYYICIPFLIYPGQTLGKRLMDIKIEYNTKKDLFIRQLMIMIVFMSGGHLIAQLISITCQYNVMAIVSDITMSLSIMAVIGLMISKQHIMLHDRLTHTYVKIVSKRIMKKQIEEENYGSFYG